MEPNGEHALNLHHQTRNAQLATAADPDQLSDAALTDDLFAKAQYVSTPPAGDRWPRRPYARVAAPHPCPACVLRGGGGCPGVRARVSRKEIYELMATDSYPRFLKSKYFLEYATGKLQL